MGFENVVKRFVRAFQMDLKPSEKIKFIWNLTAFYIWFIPFYYFNISLPRFLIDEIKIKGREIKGLSNPNEFFAFFEIFLDDTYGLRSLKGRKFSQIYDIGANLGYFTLATKYFGVDADELILVEAHPKNLKILQENIKGIKNVKVIDKAIFDKKTKLRFKFNYGKTRISEEGEDVETVTPKEVFKGNGDILVKIDIEGTEWRILDKLPYERIKYLTMETHDGEGAWENERLIKFLKDKGFEIKEFSYSPKAKTGILIAEK